ncbi:MAG: mycothione reductase [Micrococcus sp.]|nr:mycothione reductase [Micrococcus sp.]
MSEHVDLAIIGSGSGNSLVTDYWADKSVAIIDAGTFGGTCLNVGCIPTKMYAYPAQVALTGDHAGDVNVELGRGTVDFPALRDRVFSRIDAISEAGLRYRAEELEHTTVIAEEVRFTGPRELTTASGRVLTAEHVVIAAGSRPGRPEVPGVDLPSVHTSDTIMRVSAQPERLVIIGSGYIGAEFAAVFTGFGTAVTQVVRGQRLLTGHDATISDAFTEQARHLWDVRTGHTLTAIDPVADEQRAAAGWVRLTFAPTGEEPGSAADPEALLVLESDAVLLATGRVPNVDRLDVAAAGLDVTEDGVMAVDEHQRVLSGGHPVEGVWAIGDAANTWQLKHVANYEARVLAHNLEHPEDLRSNCLHPVPAAVFSQPQVASVGLTQAQAEERLGAEAVTVKVQAFGDVAYGWAMEDRTGLCKIIAEKETGQILGAHIMGHEAANLIQPLVQAMAFRIDAGTLARGMYWPHPALTEVVENALLGLEVPPPADHPER